MERTSKQIRREEKERKRQQKLTPILSADMGPTPSPKRRFIPNSNQVMAGAAVVTVGLSLYTFFAQRQTDAQVKAFQGELKRISDSAEWMRQAEFAPHPIVEAPLDNDSISIRGPEHLMEAANLTIRNIGRGSSYDLSAHVVYDGMKKSSERQIKHGGPVGPFDVLNETTLAAGQVRPFKVPKWILYPEESPQVVTGRVEMKCRDESQKLCFFIQPFWLIVHLDKKNPHAHFHFESPIAVPGEVFRLNRAEQPSP